MELNSLVLAGALAAGVGYLVLAKYQGAQLQVTELTKAIESKDAAIAKGLEAQVQANKAFTDLKDQLTVTQKEATYAASQADYWRTKATEIIPNNAIGNRWEKPWGSSWK